VLQYVAGGLNRVGKLLCQHDCVLFRCEVLQCVVAVFWSKKKQGKETFAFRNKARLDSSRS